MTDRHCHCHFTYSEVITKPTQFSGQPWRIVTDLLYLFRPSLLTMYKKCPFLLYPAPLGSAFAMQLCIHLSPNRIIHERKNIFINDVQLMLLDLERVSETYFPAI